MATLWTMPDAPRPSPVKLTDAQQLFGRDICFRGNFVVTPSKDYAVVDELEAAAQSIYNEAQTEPGEHVFYPEWGMGIAQMVKKPRNSANLAAAENRVRDRLAKNPRISLVKEVSLTPFTTSRGDPGVVLSIVAECGGRPLSFTRRFT